MPLASLLCRRSLILAFNERRCGVACLPVRVRESDVSDLDLRGCFAVDIFPKLGKQFLGETGCNHPVPAPARSRAPLYRPEHPGLLVCECDEVRLQHHPLLMWHGCGLIWETTPDGRSGWHDYGVRVVGQVPAEITGTSRADVYVSVSTWQRFDHLPVRNTAQLP